MNQQKQLLRYLYKSWNQLYHSQHQSFIINSHYENSLFQKFENGFYKYYNPQLKNKTKSIINQQKRQIFLPFDQKHNFNKCSDKQILFYLNLDNEEIVSKEMEQNKTAETFQKNINQEEISQENHSIIINSSPLCQGHSLIILFPQQQLPQVVGSDLLLHLTNIFKMLGKKHSFKIGYNSIGGTTTVNHLHFHLFESEKLIKEKLLPIQKAELSLIIYSGLQKPQEQINMYNVGVYIWQFKDYPIKGFVLTPDQKSNDQTQSFNSLGFAFSIIINQLLQKEIPHNVILCNNGFKIIIVPRIHQLDNIFKKQIGVGFFQVGGVMVCQEKQFYQKLTQQQTENILKQHNCKLFDTIKNKLLKILNEYK